MSVAGRTRSVGPILLVLGVGAGLTVIHLGGSLLTVRESRQFEAAEELLATERTARALEDQLTMAEQWGVEERYFHDLGLEPLADLRRAAHGQEQWPAVTAVLAAGEQLREAVVSHAAPEAVLAARREFLMAREHLNADAAVLVARAKSASESSARRSVLLGVVAVAITFGLGLVAIHSIRRFAGRLRERSHFERTRLDSMMARLPIAAARFRGPDHVLELANPAFQALWPDRVRVGTTLSDIHPEFVAAGHAVTWDRAFRDGVAAVATEVPWSIERTPGERCAAWFNVTVEPVRDFEGRIGGVLVVAVDVTELVEARRRAEAQAERATKLEALAADLSRAATPIAIAQTLVEHATPLFGAAGCEFAQGPLASGRLAIIASLGLARSPGYLVELGAHDPVGEAALDGEANGIGPDALRRWPGAPEGIAAAQARLVRAGAQVEGVLALYFDAPRGLDLDEQAALALLLRYCAQALQRAELLDAERRARQMAEVAVRSREEAAGLVDAIFASAPVGLGVWDRDLRYVRVNEALAQMHDSTPDAHVGRRPTELVPRLARGEEIERWLRRVLETGEPVVGIETEGEGDGGERSIWRQSWYPVRVRGEIAALAAVVEDVSEHRRADAERARLVTVLEEAVRVRDEFLSIASHELKTPLTTLDLHLRRLERNGDSWPEARRQQAVRAAVRSSERLARLVTNLLDVSQVCADRLLLELEPIDLVDALRDVSERFEDELVRSGSRLVLAADGPIVGRWDRMRVDQITSNLISNAIKFGAGKPIEIRVEHDHEHVRLIVRDSGLGIAPEDQERVFRRFERAVSSRHFGGLGLGLWIARQSAMALGGRILLSSTPGRGSSFAVELPIRGPAAEA